MASAGDFASAFAKAERAAGRRLPTGGRAFLSVRDRDKAAVLPVARALLELGFELVATAGTAIALADDGIPVQLVEKGEPVVHLVRRRGVDLVVNTPEGRNARTDGYAIREAAVVARVPCITTLAVARAAVEAIEKALAEPARTLQERHAAGASLVASSPSRRSARTRCCASRAARSTRACRASSSCSRRRGACCRGRCRSASRRAASWRS